MAQKLLKRKPRKVAPKRAQVEETGRAGAPRTPSAVLVGMCKTKQLVWIKRHGIYNYPVKDGDEFDEKSFASIKELWLYADVRGTRHVFEAEFIGIKTRDELVNEYGYPANGVFNAETQRRRGGRAVAPRPPHGSRYCVFKTKYLEYGTRLDDPFVIARTADFGGRSAKVKKAIEQFKADGEFAPLEHYLPSDLAKVPRNRLRVCEAAVQYDSFPQLLKPVTISSMTQRPKYTFFDLFAGCGGLSLGLERAGFTPLLVNELNPDAMSTYLLNRRDEYPWLCDNNVSNVKDLVLDEKLLGRFRNSIKNDFGIDIFNGELDLICGGPPCQGFSGLGIRRSYSVEKKQLPSNYLYQDMAFLVNRIRPKIFLFENVRGLLSARWTDKGEKGEIFKDVLKTFRDIGAYHIRYKLVHAKDYGVPQNRPRILIVGLRQDVFPEPTVTSDDAVLAGFLPKPVGGYPSIEELLGDLVDSHYVRGALTETYPSAPKSDVQIKLRTKRDGTIFKAGEPVTEMEYSNHSDFIVEKFTEMIRNGGEIPERFKTKKFAQKVLPRTWGKDGPTITACSAPDDYVHFCQPRSLTVREWARLQMFPDWYVFAGKRTTGGLRRAGNPREGIFDRELPKYTQIGNAVPVELAYNVGSHFVKLLEGVKQHVESSEHFYR